MIWEYIENGWNNIMNTLKCWKIKKPLGFVTAGNCKFSWVLANFHLPVTKKMLKYGQAIMLPSLKKKCTFWGWLPSIIYQNIKKGLCGIAAVCIVHPSPRPMATLMVDWAWSSMPPLKGLNSKFLFNEW